jgi:hypothetical protein
LITVLLPFKDASGTMTLQLKREGSTYWAHMGNTVHSLNVRVFDRGEMPEFEVR